MLTVRKLLKDQGTIKDENYYVILWSANCADEFDYPLFFYGKWSKVKSILEDLSEEIEIEWEIWNMGFGDIYYDILESEVFEVDKKYEALYNSMYKAAIDISEVL